MLYFESHHSKARFSANKVIDLALWQPEVPWAQAVDYNGSQLLGNKLRMG